MTPIRIPLQKVLLFFLVANFPIKAIESLDALEIGGTYRMNLTTGDVLECVVEEKTDSNIIIETQGTPYTFHKYLIKEFSVVSPPPAKNSEKGNDTTEKNISYKQLLNRPEDLKNVIIRIQNDSEYEGTIHTIDSRTIKLDVQGSIISISKNIIKNIRSTDENKKKLTSNQGIKKNRGTNDTLVLANDTLNESGKTNSFSLIIGEIQFDSIDSITILDKSGTVKNISRKKIVRVIRHTQPTFEQKIKNYAKPLFCGSNMILIDLPPGDESRPFFKVCIDKYEFPNQRGSIPTRNISYNDAASACNKVGKRLCRTDEWEWACSGLERYPYPYGYQLEQYTCNRDGHIDVEESGSRIKCVGKFGVYDMVGNIFEWVTGTNGSAMVMGGPLTKCQTKSPGMSGSAKPQVGFRCCKSN